jgi:hypothetical protein
MGWNVNIHPQVIKFIASTKKMAWERSTYFDEEV